MTGVLTSNDGAFSCTPDSAVEIAHMVNLMETVISKEPFAAMELGEVLERYCSGSSSITETIAELKEWIVELDAEAIKLETKTK